MALPPDFYEERFNISKKCKISWNIIKIDEFKNDDCIKDIRLYLDKKDGDNSTFLNATWLAIEEWCWVEVTFPTYNQKWEAYYPKVWDGIYAIINADSKYILKLGKAEYEKYSEIPVCSTNEVIKSDSLSNYFIVWLPVIIISVIGIYIYLLFKKKKQKK